MRLPIKYAAFTLTEILIALAIMGIVLLSAMQLFNAVQINMEVNEKQANRLREIQLAVRQIEDDIQHFVFRERRNEYGDRVALLRGKTSSVDSFLEFTRTNWRNPAKLARSNLQHIVYKIEDTQLIRNHWLYVDNASEGQELKRPLLTGLESVEFEFLKEDDWQKQWEAEEDRLSDLPKAIKVTLTLEDLGEVYRIFPLASFDGVKVPTNQAPANTLGSNPASGGGKPNG
ncbi:type II secretion system minor pseudopilin GspJ [Kangiella sp. TOML190]|uniref:type II secretion system minor pseudopilin GspJ n=1 Tax=Kangiella sp. TOML190 TaxID=2931351 RepID=UPI00203FB9A8|nr:type II secretion system minor pseudopilin GspJ [Kangiella sp. TOML190]